MKNWHFETKLSHAGFDKDAQTGATVVPIYQSAGFSHETAEDLSDVFNNRKFGYTYSRIANPTVDYLELKIKELENARAVASVSSGMAAISIAIQSIAIAGDEIVVGNSLFGGTYYLLKELEDNHGIKVNFVESTDTAAYEAAITTKTKLIFNESIGNPKLDIPDIQAIAEIAQKNNIPYLIDATTVTPYMINLKALGVSVVVHSATKWISGHGNAIGGLIVDLGNTKWENSNSKPIKEFSKKMGALAFIARCKKLRSNLGAPLSPFNAFLLDMGITTLALRMEKQCQNSLEIARFLEKHPKVKQVSYPGLSTHPQHALAKKQFKENCFGSLLTLKLESKEACFKLINSLKLIKNVANLGDVKTLIIHPDSTIYRDMSREEKDAAGAFENLIRISVGIENAEDLINDLATALEK